jgi:hypothetical protein
MAYAAKIALSSNQRVNYQPTSQAKLDWATQTISISFDMISGALDAW